MSWNELAPWIAIAITLALSILVPLFTQIANNRHQRKLQKEKFEYEEEQKKRQVYIDFVRNVGSVILYAQGENTKEAGASMYEMYAYAPPEWRPQLDKLYKLIYDREYEKAAEIMKDLNSRVSDALNNRIPDDREKHKRKRNKKVK